MEENLEVDIEEFLLENAIENIYKELKTIVSIYIDINNQNNSCIENINKQNKKLNLYEKKFKQLSLQNELQSKENEKYKSLINNLNEQIEDIKRKIILSTDNSNKNGRPPLSSEDIQFIKDLRKRGMTQRQVAEYMGIGNGTVAKYDKLENEDLTPSNIF